MATVVPIRKLPAPPIPQHAQALDNLSFIRTAMENAGSFTAVSGAGGIWMGATALISAVLAHRSGSQQAWLNIWVGEAALAFALALLFCSRKAVRSGTILLSKPFRRFALAMAPSVLSGVVLTLVLLNVSGTRFLPALWLLLYGAGVASAGAFSVRIVPLMGISFMLAGTVAAVAPSSWADFIMAAGFGGLHLLFGFLIARGYRG